MFLQKVAKFSKTVLPCFGDLVAGQSSRMYPVANSYSRFSRLTGRPFSQSRKILRKFFKKFGFSGFAQLRLATCSRVKALIARVTQKFSWLLSRLPREWNFQSRKTLRQIFQKFHFKCLAACPSDLFQSQKLRVLHFRVILKIVLKNFSLFPYASFSLIIPSSLALYFLFDPFVYSCKKGGEHTLELYIGEFSHFYMTVLVYDQVARCSRVSHHVYLIAIYLLHYTCHFITCFTLRV